ncbi:MAG TPA: hypothetical protein VG710_05200, partial [Opitutus sp.]|nr:hypothetical protein [Opitutus sp.]
MHARLTIVNRLALRLLCGLGFVGAIAPLRAADRVELGRLSTGAAVAFVRDGGTWGLAITGGPAPEFRQAKPARIEVYRADADIRELDSGYAHVEKSAGGIDATANVTADGGVAFHVQDHWSVQGAVLSVRRSVSVTGSAAGGFASSVVLAADAAWNDVNCFAPGVLYGDPAHNGERAPGGALNAEARHFLIREDLLPAPLFALSFADGASVSVLDPAPRGDSTVEETKLTQDAMTDRRFEFGALGAWQADGSPVEFGFTFPGSMGIYPFDPMATAPEWFRRYHPIAPGVSHHYEVRFRFGANESFRDVTRDSWRWAWRVLRPTVPVIDVEEVRRVLLDHLEAHAATIDGRTGIPFVLNTITDKLQWNWTMIAIGFVGKNLECADQLLREGDRDPTERGKKMRATGLAIISSLITALHDVPLKATGYDLSTGRPWDHIWLAPWLRNATESMRTLMLAYRREHALGRDHPEWFAWMKNYVDWLVLQQRADGSFPRRWKAGSSEVAEPTGTASYCPVPLLVLMTAQTGDPKYQQAARRAADYVWKNWGERGLFVGGASDNPNIT